eukprot:scaffold91440_cov53-Phaeocystis_antarctica.AAC.3
MASTAAATVSSSELSVEVPGLPPDYIRLRTVLPRKAGEASQIEIPNLELPKPTLSMSDTERKFSRTRLSTFD